MEFPGKVGRLLARLEDPFRMAKCEQYGNAITSLQIRSNRVRHRIVIVESVRRRGPIKAIEESHET